jgi:SAM-dependent methyltransferase
VLDIGTGRGAVLAPAAVAVGPSGRAVGVDLAPTMVALTAADMAGHPHVEVVQADAARLPADLGTFDAVLSSLVLFFTDDPAAVLRDWAARVAPGGRLGLVTFVEDPDDGRMRDLLKAHVPRPEAAPVVLDAEGDEPSAFDLVRDPSWLDARLADAGLSTSSATVLRHATRFADGDQFWDWAWSHGMRAALEQLPEEDHEVVRHALAAELDANRLPDGDLALHVSVRITVARG